MRTGQSISVLARQGLALPHFCQQICQISTLIRWGRPYRQYPDILKGRSTAYNICHESTGIQRGSQVVSIGLSAFRRAAPCASLLTVFLRNLGWALSAFAPHFPYPPPCMCPAAPVAELAGERGRFNSKMASPPHSSIPAIQAVIKLASAPATIVRTPSRAKSCWRSGAIPPIPPIVMPIEPILANPHSA